MATALLLVIAAATVVAAIDWRRGFMACIVVGFAQEPLRKLTPGVPTSYQVIVGVTFAAMVLGTLLSGQRLRLRFLHFGNRQLETAWQIFIVVILLQATHTLFRYGNPILPLFGLVFYLTPLIAMTTAILFVRSERDILRLLRFYLLLGVPTAATVYLSYTTGGSHPLLQEVGDFVGNKLIIYQFGTGFYSHSGIMRVGETAAWHAAAGVAFLVILGLLEKKPTRRILIAAVIVLLLGAILLTGRRKMLAALGVFLATYWMSMSGLGLAVRTRMAGTVLSATVVALLILGFWGDDPGTGGLYVKRGVSVFEDASERVRTAFHLMYAALWSQGPLGAGAGVSAHGAQFFGGGWQIYGADESGLGKIAGELGIPGLLAIGYLLYRLILHVRKLLRYASRHNRQLTVVTCGLVSFVVGNVFAFMTATQLFGDPFVLLMLGWTSGFVLAIPRLAMVRRRVPTRQGAPHPALRSGAFAT